MGVKVTCRTDGPYFIEGEIELYDANGHPFNLNGRTRVVLCRCGASRSKPFCDGAHNRIRFECGDAAQLAHAKDGKLP